MNIDKSIVLEVFKNISFLQKDIDFIYSKFEKITLKRGDVLINPDSYIYHQYYISSGCLRSYFFHKSGKEYTIQFAIKNWWISDYTSFFTSEKSILNVECIQDAVIYKLSKEDLDMVCSLFPEIELFIREKLEKAFASFQKRILDYLSKSAKERYLQFIDSYPTIEQHVKNYHIASYLGITTESLSRVRKKLRRN